MLPVCVCVCVCVCVLQLNTSSVHRSGALLLEPINQLVMEGQLPVEAGHRLANTSGLPYGSVIGSLNEDMNGGFYIEQGNTCTVHVQCICSSCMLIHMQL